MPAAARATRQRGRRVGSDGLEPPRCDAPHPRTGAALPHRAVSWGRERHHGIRLGVITGSGHNPNPLTLSYLPAECRATVDLPSVFSAAFRGVTKSSIRAWPYRLFPLTTVCNLVFTGLHYLPSLAASSATNKGLVVAIASGDGRWFSPFPTARGYGGTGFNSRWEHNPYMGDKPIIEKSNSQSIPDDGRICLGEEYEHRRVPLEIDVPVDSDEDKADFEFYSVSIYEADSRGRITLPAIVREEYDEVFWAVSEAAFEHGSIGEAYEARGTPEADA